MEPDLLGAPYERETIDLGRDEEGPVVATLVRRRSDRRTGRAVLHVHGFVDYFFQTHVADFFVERGWDFYAIDLRKYGRSLLPHQTPNFCHEISDYFTELDIAAELIRGRDGNRTLLVTGHSTGGLITALWANDRRDADIVDGLFLNSPFFDLKAPWVVRRPLAAVVSRIATRTPYRIVPRGLSKVYGQSLHAEHNGEWLYDLAWKPLGGFPVRAGWLAAIRRAQQRLRAGLEIPVPVMLACSTRTFRGTAWHDSAALADAVLDVEHMVRWAPKLGRHVTLARFDGGMHDLTLSGAAVRERVLRDLGRWADAFVPAPAEPPVEPPATLTAEPTGPTERLLAEPPAGPLTAPPGPATTAPPGPATTAPPRPVTGSLTDQAEAVANGPDRVR